MFFLRFVFVLQLFAGGSNLEFNHMVKKLRTRWGKAEGAGNHNFAKHLIIEQGYSYFGYLEDFKI